MISYGISTRLLDLRFHRGAYLPHCRGPGAIQFVTFRVADSLPAGVLESWRDELASLTDEERHLETFRRVERALDQQHGEAPLKAAELAEIVVRILRRKQGIQYDLLAFVVMPTHVHVVFAIRPGFLLQDIVGVWKYMSAKRINRVLGRGGQFWARDYYDRVVRDDDHLRAVVAYVRENPVKAGLCASAAEWPWSGASAEAVASQLGSAPAS